MTRIATYVFIDLETTSVPKLEYNKTKITELSMVVVKRRHILDTRPGASPRVQDKLTMCFNPLRMIDPGSTEASGLCNDLLEHQTDFNLNVFNTISGFLQCLEKPVCLVAQNGYTFDFPILKRHFEKLKMCLSDDILCADSLHAFYDIFEAETSETVSSNVDEDVIDNITNSAKLDESLDDQIKDKQMTNNIEDGKITPNLKQVVEEQITPELLRDLIENEDLKTQHYLQQQNEKTPVHVKQQLRKPPNRISKVKRKLFWGNNPKPKRSYKLKDIYERVLHRPAIEAHRAENDCIMAMEISVSIAKQFVAWVDNNHCQFNEVKPMQLGVPLD